MNDKLLYMPCGICHISVVPVRAEASHASEMVTQLLFGELLQVIDRQAKWSYVRLEYDGYEGWVDNKQFVEISDKECRKALRRKTRLAHKWITKLKQKTSDNVFLYIPKGATLSNNHLLQCATSTQRLVHQDVVATAMEYLDVPYLWGGRTPFGIDCSGFTQIVYKLNGIKLFRDASQQALQGELISFLEESIPGDLAFFEDAEGNIIHVGILLGDNRIIHAHGKVRIDRIDHVGIYNKEIRNYSHHLRMMKRVF